MSQSNHRPDDSILLKKFQATGDSQAFAELYKQYSGFVFLISMKYLKDQQKSEDSVMQIFEKLFSDLHRHEIDNFKSWLHVVTKNHCLQLLKNHKRELFFLESQQNNSETFMENASDSYHTNTEALEKDQYETELKAALAQLKPEQTVCIKLFYFENKTYKEIADDTGFTEKQVKSYIQNGKRNLKNKLTQLGFILIVIYIGAY